MMIKNFNYLAATTLRKQALQIVDAGLEEMQTRAVVSSRVSLEHNGSVLQIADQKFPLQPYKRIIVVGFGTASIEAAAELQQLLGDRITSGYIIDVAPGNFKNITSKIGTHPLPSVTNVAAVHELIALLKTASADDLILCVISDGGSSLLSAPAHITVEQERQITETLVKAGASVAERNTVRKHMSLVKGGQLAKIAYPARRLKNKKVIKNVRFIMLIDN